MKGMEEVYGLLSVSEMLAKHGPAFPNLQAEVNDRLRAIETELAEERAKRVKAEREEAQAEQARQAKEAEDVVRAQERAFHEGGPEPVRPEPPTPPRPLPADAASVERRV